MTIYIFCYLPVGWCGVGFFLCSSQILSHFILLAPPPTRPHITDPQLQSTSRAPPPPPRPIPSLSNRSWTQVWRRSKKIKKSFLNILFAAISVAPMPKFGSRREKLDFLPEEREKRLDRRGFRRWVIHFTPRLINLRDSVTWWDRSAPLGNSVRLRSNFSSTPYGSKNGW